MKDYLYLNKGKPIKIVGISCSKRAENDCARHDPISLELLKKALNFARKNGATTKLIKLRDLEINPCKECYSTNPSQCRFNEETFQCDCYAYNEDSMLVKDEVMPMKKAYDLLSKKDFFEIYESKEYFARKDEMHIIYKELLEADAVIFAGPTQFYSRNSLLQNMFSRLCALDGGVQELWGDGKDLKKSIKHSKNKGAIYRQRLYGKWCAFINSSKEGDLMSPDLMKACSMMGMKIMPLGCAYNVSWYKDKTHAKDYANALSDDYTNYLIEHMGTEMVELIKQSQRTYGKKSKTV